MCDQIHFSQREKKKLVMCAVREDLLLCIEEAWLISEVTSVLYLFFFVIALKVIRDFHSCRSFQLWLENGTKEMKSRLLHTFIFEI